MTTAGDSQCAGPNTMYETNTERVKFFVERVLESPKREGYYGLVYELGETRGRLYHHTTPEMLFLYDEIERILVRLDKYIDSYGLNTDLRSLFVNIFTKDIQEPIRHVLDGGIQDLRNVLNPDLVNEPLPTIDKSNRFINQAVFPSFNPEFHT